MLHAAAVRSALDALTSRAMENNSHISPAVQMSSATSLHEGRANSTDMSAIGELTGNASEASVGKDRVTVNTSLSLGEG